MPSEITVSQPLVVRAAESLTGAPIRFVGKETLVKLAAGNAANPISVLEDVSPPHHGPPLHKHDFEEFFYILSGEFLFELDGTQLRVSAGDFVHAPSGVPHVFQNITDEPARMLVVARPGGIENYFCRVGRARHGRSRKCRGARCNCNALRHDGSRAAHRPTSRQVNSRAIRVRPAQIKSEGPLC